MRCEACDGEFEGRGRFCKRGDCTRARARARKRESRGTVVELPAPDSSEVPSNYTATLRALEAAERLGTPAGVNALTLAQRLDTATAESGSGIAALSKQHLAALEEATRNARVAADPVDELRARRERRRA